MDDEIEKYVVNFRIKMHMVIHLHGAIVARIPDNLWAGNTASSTSLAAGGTLVYLAERADEKQS
jgi:hypothetical protein